MGLCSLVFDDLIGWLAGSLSLNNIILAKRGRLGRGICSDVQNYMGIDGVFVFFPGGFAF